MCLALFREAAEDEEEDGDNERALINSPEPPEPLEPEDLMQGSSEAGQLHHEQNLGHVFRVGVWVFPTRWDPSQSDLRVSKSPTFSHSP